MKVAMVPPMPGRTPITKPRGELRIMGQKLRFQSSLVIQTLPMCLESNL